MRKNSLVREIRFVNSLQHANLDTLIKSFIESEVLFMPNMVNFNLQVPEELFIKAKNVSESFRSDFESDMVHLLECYVDSYQKIMRDPAAKALLNVK